MHDHIFDPVEPIGSRLDVVRSIGLPAPWSRAELEDDQAAALGASITPIGDVGIRHQRRPVSLSSSRRPAPAPVATTEPEPVEETAKDPCWMSELLGFLSRRGYRYSVCTAAVAWVQSRGRLDAHPEIDKADWKPANDIIARCIKREVDYESTMAATRAAAAELRRVFPPSALAPVVKFAPAMMRGHVNQFGTYRPSAAEEAWRLEQLAREAFEAELDWHAAQASTIYAAERGLNAPDYMFAIGAAG